MRSSHAKPRKPLPWIRITLLTASTFLLAGWTCGVFFVSCLGLAQPQIASLSPDTISSDAELVLLTVEGTGFTPQSQIMWNSNALPTTLMDPHHLETTITQQTFDSLGGSAGSATRRAVLSRDTRTRFKGPVEGPDRD